MKAPRGVVRTRGLRWSRLHRLRRREAGTRQEKSNDPKDGRANVQGTLRAPLKLMLPKSALRTEQNTPRSLNERILRRTEQSIQRAVSQGPQAIERRLQELDAEWDTERTLETMAASFGLVGFTLGATVNRKWYALSGVVAGFLLQHGLQGWCPPLPLVRALGVRTVREIEAERFALKLARGDFRTDPYSADERSPQALPNALRLTELPLLATDSVGSAASGA